MKKTILQSTTFAFTAMQTMTKKLNKGFLLFTISLFIGMVANAITYYSQSSSAAQTLANYNSNRLGGGSIPANFTTAGDIFVIQGTGNGGTSPHTMTVSSTMTVGSASNNTKLQVENGGILTATSALTIGTAGQFQLDNGSTYNHSHTGTITNVLAGVETMGATSNFNVTTNAQVTNGTTVTSPGLGNFTYSGAGTMQCNAGFPDLQGNLTINPSSAGTLRLAAGTAGRTTYAIGGDLIISNLGTLDYGNGAVVGLTINLSGNMNITATGNTGTTTPFVFVGTGGVSGTPVSANLNFAKAGTQTFTSSNSTMATAAAASFRQFNFTVNSGSTLSIGTQILQTANTTTFNFTVASGGGLTTANTGGITVANTATGSVQNLAGTRTFSTGADYTYNGTSAQVLGTGFTGARNLTISNTSGATPSVTINSSYTISGNFSVTTGDIRNTSGTGVIITMTVLLQL